jgi:hypothetical protein
MGRPDKPGDDGFRAFRGSPSISEMGANVASGQLQDVPETDLILRSACK